MPSVPPLPVALVGCGAVAELFYAPALRELERQNELVVRVLVDPDAANRRSLQTAFPNATAAGDSGALKDVRLAIIASPPPFHASQAIAALEAGIGVLCEKPMASKTAEAERMIASARATGQVLAIGLFRRFFTTTRWVRQLAESGALGRAISFTIYEGGPFSWPAKSDSFFRRESSGGGVLLDIGVHVLDLALHWFGEPEGFDYADDAMGGVEANCRLNLRFAGNLTGAILLSRDYQTSNRYVFEFERGTVVLRNGEASEAELHLKNSSLNLAGRLGVPATVPFSPEQGPVIQTQYQAFMAQISDVVRAVRDRVQPMVPGEEGIRSLRLIEKCYAQRTLLPMPWLTTEEQAVASRFANQEKS